MPPTALALPRRAVCGLLATALLTSVLAVGSAVAATPPQTTITGPDVSSYQHPRGAAINWRKVKRSGHEFAIIKATEGTSYRNPWFARDYRESRRAGLVRGSYHFARPGYPIVRNARRQAHYFVDHIGSATTSRTLPPALDLEVTGGLSRGPLVTWAQTFLLTVRQQTGRIPMIYTYPSFWQWSLGDPAALARYPLWMASYSSHPSPTPTLWQYTSRAFVSGIRGSVDMSRLTASPESWQVLSDGRIAEPWPAATPGDPQKVTAAGGDSRVDVSWLPPDTGSNPIRSYTVTATTTDPVTGAVTTAATKTVDALHFSTRLGGLSNGTAYSVTVTAANSRGAGPASDPLTVTPLVPVALTPTAPTTPYGDDANVRVTLTRPDTHRPLAGRELQVQQRDPVTRAWTPLPPLTTDSDGAARLSFPRPQHNFDLRFSFDAPTGWQHVRKVVHVKVANRVSAHLSKTRMHSGHSVSLRGRIRPQVGDIEVKRQAYYRGGWHTVQRTRTAADGSYLLRFTLTTATKVRKAFRVVVVSFDGRSGGFSPVRHITVRR